MTRFQAINYYLVVLNCAKHYIIRLLPRERNDGRKCPGMRYFFLLVLCIKCGETRIDHQQVAGNWFISSGI
jgi:hypothetical protein